MSDEKAKPKSPSGGFAILKRQTLPHKDVALVQREGTNEFRLLPAELFTKYTPEDVKGGLPAKFEMASTDWGKLIKPESFGKNAGLGDEATVAIDFALWRRGIFTKVELADAPDAALQAAGHAVSQIVQRSIRTLAASVVKE